MTQVSPTVGNDPSEMVNKKSTNGGQQQHTNPVPEQLRIKCGKKLHCRYWEPTVSPRGLVMLIHGLAEHLGCYDELGCRLAAENFLAFGHDHVGHGMSDGHRVHVESIDEYVTDILNHIQLMREEHPQIPIFAVGHSMGGMILLSAALKEPSAFDGVVLMGPLIFIDPALASPVKLWAARLLSRVTPQLAVSSLDVADITSDEAEQELIKNDPLIWHGGVKCKWATATHECLVEINKKLTSMKVPFAVLHAEQDKLCNVQGSHALFEKAQVKDKHLKVYPNGRHHLYRETQIIRQEVLDDTVSWICQRAPSRT
ncbi:monoglyceride lipase-like [Daphnia carinata]|uniref:monoglyceride lipase-like n=1 Tax=Daphnia carinata TaxID=120202 RepID=UPI00257AAD75|nr:monoglyceride lipase-like [Daphnia carinata]